MASLNITGCTYTIKDDMGVDLAEFSFLLINDKVKIKLTGGSRKLTTNMYQLPSNRFVIPGKYKCIIEAKRLYNDTVSSTSNDIPMPGLYTFIEKQSFALVLRNRCS